MNVNKHFVILLFFLNILSLSGQIQIGNTLIGMAAGDEFGGSVDFSEDGNRLAVGARLNDEAGDNAGQVSIFDWNGFAWEQVGSSINGEEDGDLFYKLSLSADGNRIIIGAYKNDDMDDNSGHARIFDWNGLDWEQLGETLTGESANNYFGFAVSMSADGNIVAVGAPQFDHLGKKKVGFVKTYEWKDDSWMQLGQTLFGVENWDNFGLRLALTQDGKRLAINAPSLEFPMANFHSYTKIYELVDSTWKQIGDTFLADNVSDVIGRALCWSADGNTIGIGSDHQTAGSAGIGLGRVDVYQWNAANWTEKGQAIIGATHSALGTSLALSASGDTMAIGAVFGDETTEPFLNAGQVYMYRWNDMNEWERFGDIINGTGENNRASEKIALTADGNRLAVGATWNNDGGEHSGHVRVFSFESTTGLPEKENKLNPLSATYPNPTKGQIKINLGVKYAKVNLVQKDYLNQNIFFKSYEDISEIDFMVKGMPGIYFLELTTNLGTREVIKVVKL